MEVIVHGTKGGYKSLKKTERAPSIASDIRNNAVVNTILGISFYALAYTNNGFVFSKYKIVIDSLRSYATGFIAFSIILPQNKKLKGEDIKAMLDEMLNHYDTNYITNNKMNRGEISPIVDEDWTFLNEITNRYQELPQLLEFDLKPGEKEAAFILYKDKSDLVEYFSKPYQEEFTHHKQVFLIDKEQNHDDLLKFIKNSGIELKGIDLNNDYFILTNYEPHKNVIIKANGKQLSNQKNNNIIIRANDLLEIDFKINNFYKEIHSEGKLSDTGSEIRKYLDISVKQIKIKYYAFIPEPITKKIIIHITDPNGYIIENAEIFYKSDNKREEKVINNQVILKGEDLGENLTVRVQKGNYKGTGRLVPNNYYDGQTFQISLKEETKKAEIINEKKPQYKIEPGSKGTLLKENCYSNKEDGSDINVKETIQSKLGWKFNGFIVVKTHNDNVFDGALIAQYKRDYKPLIYTASIILPLVIVAGLFLFVGPSTYDTKQTQELKNNIEDYIDGIQLMPNQLDTYDYDWKQLQSGKIIEEEDWGRIKTKIDNAINIRTSINNLDIENLKNINYSSEQQKFEEVIKRVDITDRALLLDCLGKDSIAKLNLDEIAKSIQNTLGLQTKIIEDIPNSNTGFDREDSAESTASNIEINEQANTDRRSAKSQAVQNNNRSQNKVIIDKLKSGDISKLDLDDLKKNVTDSKLKKSIELYLEFWEIANNNNRKPYENLRDKIKNTDNYIKNSALEIFLNEIVNYQEKFSEYILISGRNIPTKTINDFKTK